MCLYYRIKKKVPFKLNIGKNPFIELKMRMCVYFDSIKSSKTSRPEKNRNRTREFKLNEEQSYGSNVNGQLQQCPKKTAQIKPPNKMNIDAIALLIQLQPIYSRGNKAESNKKKRHKYTHIHKHEKNSGARADIKPKL